MSKTIIFNADIDKIKKSSKKKKYLHVVNILKKFIKAITIKKQILNLEISLIVNKLPMFALLIKKQLIKVFFKYKYI